MHPVRGVDRRVPLRGEASGAGAIRARALPGQPRRPVRRALDTILGGHLPYPAIVVRHHGILVTAHRAFDVFNEGVDPALLEPPPTCSATPSIPMVSRHDPALEELLAELESYLPPLPKEPEVLRRRWARSTMPAN